MNTNDLFPSPYLKASDVAHEPVVTIAKIEREKMKNKEGKEEAKPVIYFREYEKGVVLNRTNANVIESLYGSEVDEWVGSRIQLCSAMVEAFGERKPAIRVKEQKPPADKKALLERYSKLYERGVKAGVADIENYAISADMPEAEIVELGKELKGKVEAAESF